MNKSKRIVARTQTVRNEHGEYHVKAFDQGGNRYETADYFTDDRDDARETARAMVNDSAAKAPPQKR